MTSATSLARMLSAKYAGQTGAMPADMPRLDPRRPVLQPAFHSADCMRHGIGLSLNISILVSCFLPSLAHGSCVDSEALPSTGLPLPVVIPLYGNWRRHGPAA